MTGAIQENQPGLGNAENSLKVLDIFSGIGGMSLGLERAGMQTISFCESGRIQQLVLRRQTTAESGPKFITTVRGR